MADAYEDIIADAIVAELNDVSRAWYDVFQSEEAEAVRTRTPWIRTATELNRLKVFVVPLTLNKNASGARTNRIARGQQVYDYGIPIILQRAVREDDDTLMKLLSKCAEDIHEFYEDAHFIDGMENEDNWHAYKADRAMIFDHDMLYGQQVWATSIDVTVRGFRA